MKQPLVSIIMPAYNTEKYIGEAIESIINQTYKNWELLIADDYSTDKTKEIIESYKDKRIKKYYNSSNLQVLRTINKLLQYVSGDYITFLASDDTCHPERIELQLNEFKKDTELAMCGCNGIYIDENGSLIGNINKPSTYEEILSENHEQNAFISASIMVKTDIMMSMGGYRDFFYEMSNEDYDLTSRIIEKHKAINVKARLYYYRQRENSYSRKISVLYDPYRLHGHKLVQKFIEERKIHGIDSLERNDFVTIRYFILDLHKPYIDDPSKIYRELAASYMSAKLFKKARHAARDAIKKNPFNFVNYRTWFYCLRKSIF